MAGLFDTFTVAKRGLNVQQSAINTTSHNIANANTEGYSRQRAVAETTKPFGGMSKFDTVSVGQVGTGAEVTSIQRIRDSFIDYQVRNENGKLGNYDVASTFLSQVEDIFAEPSDTGIQKLFGEFYASFQELAKTPEKSASRTVALQKTLALTDALNHTYTQLEKKVTDAQELLQSNVNDINSYLDQINELNKQISSVCAVGQTPNDLMDKRDNLLDEVSKMFGITVERRERETINLKAEGFQADGNTIENLVNSDPNGTYTRFSYVKGVDVKNTDASGKITKMEVSYYPLGDSKKTPKVITITGTDLAELKGSLEQNRMLTANEDGDITYRSEITPSTTPKTYETKVLPSNIDLTATPTMDISKSLFKIYEYDNTVNSVDPKNIKGEVAGNQSVQDQVIGYMKDLDRIAASIAYSVNAIVTGNTTTSTTTTPKTAPDGKVYDMLFVTSDSNGTTAPTDEHISAKTITVNKDILDNTSKLNCKANNTDGERNGDRAQAIADLISTKINMSNIENENDPSSIGISELTRAKFFASGVSGVTLDPATSVKIQGSTDGKTIDAYYKDIISELGTKTQEANRKADTQRETILKNLENQRLSVSGVSLDEEMTNLIQFQHAYQANAKMISTVDELLDVVINGLKR